MERSISSLVILAAAVFETSDDKNRQTHRQTDAAESPATTIGVDRPGLLSD